MASSRFVIVLLLVAVVGIVPAVSPAFAQGGMRIRTSGKSLDVLVEPTWTSDGQATFKVSFLKPGTDTVQVHIDYAFVIKQGGKQVFNAAPPGQPLLHTAEGVVTIPTSPYKFPGNGNYDIEVSVAGINFIPMQTETSTFSINVTPEFPNGLIIAALASLTAATLVLSRKFHLGIRI